MCFTSGAASGAEVICNYVKINLQASHLSQAHCDCTWCVNFLTVEEKWNLINNHRAGNCCSFFKIDSLGIFKLRGLNPPIYDLFMEKEDVAFEREKYILRYDKVQGITKLR